MWFIYVLIGTIVGSLIVYLIQRPQMKSVIQLDKETEQINKQLKQANKELEIQNTNLLITQTDLNSRRSEILENISLLEKQAQEAGQIFFKENYELAEANFAQKAEEMANKFQEEQEKAEQEYLITLADMAKEMSNKLLEYNQELKDLEYEIAEKQQIVSAAVAANKRSAEMANKVKFYCLNLSDSDIEEIKKLREVSKYLRDSEPLNKVIWKVYYEKPCTDLIGRVIGGGIHTGIYKITNIQNNMCYVGQAANLADRWKQHIKRGVGAETPTRNKLYPAMLEMGVENFTFEIIEECNRESLNEKEDYWQDFFKAKEFGYSIK